MKPQLAVFVLGAAGFALASSGIGAGAPGSAWSAPPAAVSIDAPRAARALIATAAPGTAQFALLDCRNGRPVATAAAPAPLSSDPVFAPDGRSLVLTAGALLLRYELPGLRELARAALAYEPTAIAVADGDDGVVLAGGRGAGALSAHDPVSLAEAWRAPREAPFAASAIRAEPARRRFVVAFSDLAQAWEIAWGRDAPPVLQGLVHDYRSNEAVPLPGRFTPRRFELPGPTAALVGGPAPYELARLDLDGRLGIVHLDVRREIERPALAPGLTATRITAWRGDGRRGWLVAAPDASELAVLESTLWRVTGRIGLDGDVLALTTAGAHPLVAHRHAGNVAVAQVDLARRVVETVATRIPAGSAPLRFVRGSGECVALVDRDGRWLAGFDAAPPR